MAVERTMERLPVIDVRRIREHPLVPARIASHGFIDQVETGELVTVEEVSAIGTTH